MGEYTLEEAIELLTKNKENAKVTMKSVEEDMAFLRDQITTTEVNIARTHNYGVKLRQQNKTQDAAADGAVTDATATRSAGYSGSTAAAAKSGGEGDGYRWKQEREEVEVFVPVPAGAVKEDIKVTILAESLKVEYSGKVILSGR